MVDIDIGQQYPPSREILSYTKQCKCRREVTFYYFSDLGINGTKDCLCGNTLVFGRGGRDENGCDIGGIQP